MCIYLYIYIYVLYCAPVSRSNTSHGKNPESGNSRASLCLGEVYPRKLQSVRVESPYLPVIAAWVRRITPIVSMTESIAMKVLFCVYTYIYIYIHTYIYIYIHTYTYRYIYIYTYIHTYIHTYTHTYICIPIYVCVFTVLCCLEHSREGIMPCSHARSATVDGGLQRALVDASAPLHNIMYDNMIIIISQCNIMEYTMI